MIRRASNGDFFKAGEGISGTTEVLFLFQESAKHPRHDASVAILRNHSKERKAV